MHPESTNSRSAVCGLVICHSVEKNKKPLISNEISGFLVRREGFEPPAFWSVARRSIQLS